MYKVHLISNDTPSIDGFVNIHLTRFSEVGGRIISKMDSSELEFIVHLIDSHKDEGILILRDFVGEVPSYLGSGLPIIEMADKIKTKVPLNKYYLGVLSNPVIPKELYPVYKGYSNKMVMVPTYFKNSTESYEYKAIQLESDLCHEFMKLWYELNKKPYALLRFMRATWYPIASILPILLKRIL